MVINISTSENSEETIRVRIEQYPPPLQTVGGISCWVSVSLTVGRVIARIVDRNGYSPFKQPQSLTVTGGQGTGEMVQYSMWDTL